MSIDYVGEQQKGKTRENQWKSVFILYLEYIHINLHFSIIDRSIDQLSISLRLQQQESFLSLFSPPEEAEQRRGGKWEQSKKNRLI